MNIIKERPPIYPALAAIFDLEKHKPIFAWGTVIYNPFGHPLEQTPELIAHEQMHGMRQLGIKHLAFASSSSDEQRIRLWWQDYIELLSFRLEEEIPAHRAEYRQLLRMHGNTRANRRHHLTAIAKRLRNPLDGDNHLFCSSRRKHGSNSTRPR